LSKRIIAHKTKRKRQWVLRNLERALMVGIITLETQKVQDLVVELTLIIIIDGLIINKQIIINYIFIILLLVIRIDIKERYTLIMLFIINNFNSHMNNLHHAKRFFSTRNVVIVGAKRTPIGCFMG
jgi:hypothetical protein